jgi:hypothetical protein
VTTRPITLLFLGLSTLACGPAPESEPMAITDVIARIDALNGQMIRVAGYLGYCGGYECHLYRSVSDKARADRYIQAISVPRERRRIPPAASYPPELGIGPGENFEFDRRAAPYNNSYVVITGRVTNACRYHGESACTDRSTDLEPTQIARWSPGGADAGNSAQ